MKKEDKYIRQWIKEVPREEPSPNFTANIMSQIKPLSAPAYQPLISKKMWSIIILSFLLLAIFLGYQEGQNTYFSWPEARLPEFNIIRFLDFGTFTSPAISLSIVAILMLWTFLLIGQAIKFHGFFKKNYVL